MEWFFLLVFGLAIQKVTEATWRFLTNAIKGMQDRIPYVIVQKQRYIDLQQKERALSNLIKAYADLSVQLPNSDTAPRELPKWQN